MSADERFWSKVDRHGRIAVPGLGSCWVWTGSVASGGYGQFRMSSPRRLCTPIVSPTSSRWGRFPPTWTSPTHAAITPASIPVISSWWTRGPGCCAARPLLRSRRGRSFVRTGIRSSARTSIRGRARRIVANAVFVSETGNGLEGRPRARTAPAILRAEPALAWWEYRGMADRSLANEDAE
jgi:hypothetical protein